MQGNSHVLRLVWLLALIAGEMGAPKLGCASTNLLNFYIGGDVGHGELRAKYAGLVATPTGVGTGTFDRRDFAWQLAAGVRGLEVLGAEIDYFDLGSGGASVGWPGADQVTNPHLSQRGEAAFAMLYLPIPVIDFYLKAGVARLRSVAAATVTGPGCMPDQVCPQFCVTGLPCGVISMHEAVATTETKFAAGAGVQLKRGNWAIRGEYERFTALGAHPILVSVGLTLSFL
jgi:opacity protein-like surface antigen